MKNVDNSKATLIFDDKTIYLGNNTDQDEMHSICLLDYANELYKDDPFFSKLNMRHRPETIAYFYNLKGISVFLNITSYSNESLRKYGKAGLLLIPNELSNEQKANLINFSKEIADFDLTIINDSKIVDGIIEHKSIRGFNKETPEELLISVFKEDLKNKKSK